MSITNPGYPVSLTDIQTEYGGTDPTGLNEYYRNGSYVPTNAYTGAIPTAGAISFADFYGSQKFTTSSTVYATAGSFSFVVPSGVTSVSTTIIAAGGGGGHGSSGREGASYGGGGGGGGAGGLSVASLAVTPGETLTVNVGAGGVAGGIGSGKTGGTGGTGGASSVARGVTSLASASGGVGGGGGSGNGNTGGAGGAGGTGSTSNGTAGTAGTSADAGTGWSAGGVGGGSSVGSGGTAGTFPTAGGNGGNGAGGGGGSSSGFNPNDQESSVGNGGDGYVKITYSQQLSAPGSFNVVVPQGVTSVQIKAVGGGGAGSQGGYDNGDNGIAGRPGSSFTGTYTVVPGSTLSVVVGAGGVCTGPGNSGSATTVTGNLNGTSQTLTAAGGTGAGTSNSPGGGSGAWYLTAGWVQTTDSNEANSAYTTWYGTRSGGYSIAGAGGAGTAGVYGGAGGGGGGPNGGFSIALGGDGGAGVVIFDWN